MSTKNKKCKKACIVHITAPGVSEKEVYFLKEKVEEALEKGGTTAVATNFCWEMDMMSVKLDKKTNYVVVASNE